MPEPQKAKGVSRRTLAYGPGGAGDRSVWNAVNAIANRTQDIARQNRTRMTNAQRERLRRVGRAMLDRVMSGL